MYTSDGARDAFTNTRTIKVTHSLCYILIAKEHITHIYVCVRELFNFDESSIPSIFPNLYFLVIL